MDYELMDDDLETPQTVPLNESDMAAVKTYLKDVIVKEEKGNLIQNPFICTFALDWQSEDRRTIQRVARIDLSYHNGEFIEGSAVPSELEKDRTIISQHFESLASGILSQREDWLMDGLLHPMPKHISHNCTTFVLWDGCGALFLSILSNSACGDTDANIVDGTRDELGRNERFQDCRENDSEWMDQNEHGWRVELR